ncbi:MAG: YggT family protein [Aquificaceae bacterium]
MVLNVIINILIIGAVVYSIGSWFEDFRNKSYYRILSKLYEPFFEGIRKVVPPIGGVDISPAIFIFLLGLLKFTLRP